METINNKYKYVISTCAAINRTYAMRPKINGMQSLTEQMPQFQKPTATFSAACHFCLLLVSPLQSGCELFIDLTS